MCADIRDGREQTLPSKGRIQMSKTNYLQIAISDLQHTAGPYRCARSRDTRLVLVRTKPSSRHHRKEQKHGEDDQMYDALEYRGPAGGQCNRADKQRERKQHLILHV